MDFSLIGLTISTLVIIALMFILKKNSVQKQIKTAFASTLVCLLICCTGLIAQILFSTKYNINPIYFDYFVYIGTCFLPVCLFLMGYIFYKTKIRLKNWILLLAIIPIISLITLWTNDSHHLFYIHYSTNINEAVYGPFLYLHTIYSYILLFTGLFLLLRYSIKNSGFFAKQSILILMGCLIPAVINILGTFGIVKMSIYLTPISFTVAMLFFAIAIFKFQFLSVTPIALQRIVDRMSDLYVVINENYKITDFNKPFSNLARYRI